MSQNKITKYFNTIRFKLALWFGGLIILSSLNTAVIINYAVAPKRVWPSPIAQRVFIAPQQKELIHPNIGFEIANTDFLQTIQEERNQFRNRVFWASAIAIGFHFIFAFVSSYFVIKKLLSPLEELNTLMSEVNDRVMYTKLEFEGRSEEINDLVRNFNDMMQRLEKAFSSQKQFVENVSHEIKTPLTIIKTNLESLLIDEFISKEDLKTSLQASVQSINNLNNLTEDLLLLSLLDNKKLISKQVKLMPLIMSIVQEQQKLADTKGITIAMSGSTNGRVLCNETLLRRAFSNVIENSIKYSPNSSEIELKVTELHNDTLVEVRDYGCGIPKDHITKVFDRFFRSDNSRSRKTGGSGLGLAITKEVINMCGGYIEISNADPGLNTKIILPTTT